MTATAENALERPGIIPQINQVIALYKERVAEHRNAPSIEEVYLKYVEHARKEKSDLIAPVHEVTSAILVDDSIPQEKVQQAAMLTLPELALSEVESTHAVAVIQTRKALVTMAAHELFTMQLGMDIASEHGQLAEFLSGRIVQATPYPLGGTPDEVVAFRAATQEARTLASHHKVAFTVETTDTLREAVTTLWSEANIETATKGMTAKEKTAFLEQLSFYTESQTLSTMMERFLTKQGDVKFPPVVQKAYTELATLMKDKASDPDAVQAAWKAFQNALATQLFDRNRPDAKKLSDATLFAIAQRAGDYLAWKALSWRTQVALAARQRKLDDAKLDVVTRFGKRALTVAQLLLVAISVSGCLPPPKGTPTPVPTDTNHDDDNTPTAPATSIHIESPTALPNADQTPVAVASISDLIKIANGGALPAGFEQADIIRPNLTTDIPGLDLVGSGGATCVVMPNRTDFWFSGFDKIMSSTVPGATLETRTADPTTRSFTFSDTNTHAPSESLLSGFHLQTALPADWGCSLAVVTGANPSLPPELNATGTVVGTLFHMVDGKIDTGSMIVFDAGFKPSGITLDGQGGIHVDGKDIPFWSLATGETITLANAFQLGTEATPVADKPVIMLENMTTVTDCNKNVFTFDPANPDAYHDTARAMIASVEAQMPNPNPDGVGFRLNTVGDPFGHRGIYDQFTLHLQSGDGVSTLPYATCGDLVMGENHARITVFFIPWFEADHPMIPIALATEHRAELNGGYNYYPRGLDEYTTYYADQAVFATMKSCDPSIQFMINVDHGELNATDIAIRDKTITDFGAFITEQLHGVPGFEQFSKDWIDVWTNNNRDPAVLQRIREFLHENFVGGKIRTD